MFSHNLVCDHFPLALLKQIPLSLIPCMKLLFQTTQSFPLTPAVWYHSHWGCPWRGVPLNLDLGFEYGSLPDLPFGFQKTVGFLFKDSVALTLHAMIHTQAKMLKNQRNYNCPPPYFILKVQIMTEVPSWLLSVSPTFILSSFPKGDSSA